MEPALPGTPTHRVALPHVNMSNNETSARIGTSIEASDSSTVAKTVGTYQPASATSSVFPPSTLPPPAPFGTDAHHDTEKNTDNNSIGSAAAGAGNNKNGSGSSDVTLTIGDDRKPLQIADAPKQTKLSKVMCLFVIDLSYLPPLTQFVILSLGIFIFFMSSGYVEEYTFRRLPNFTFGWYLTVWELLCFSGFALFELKMLHDKEVKVERSAIKQFIIVALAMTASRGLTNVSLEYLNYPTQVVFKSMKLITVMIGSILIQKKQYSSMEYVSCVMLVVSAALFALGDYDASGQKSESDVPNDPFGLFVVVLSLVFDSLHSNTQEVLLQTTSIQETMLFTNLAAAFFSFIVCVMTGEFFDAWSYCLKNSHAYPLFVFRSLFIYLGVLCFVTMMKAFGAVKATVITTVRKILSILLSFYSFPKPFVFKYFIGLVMFIVSFGINVQTIKANKAKKPAK